MANPTRHNHPWNNTLYGAITVTKIKDKDQKSSTVLLTLYMRGDQKDIGNWYMIQSDRLLTEWLDEMQVDHKIVFGMLQPLTWHQNAATDLNDFISTFLEDRDRNDSSKSSSNNSNQ